MKNVLFSCRLKNLFYVTIYMSCNELHNLQVFSCNDSHVMTCNELHESYVQGTMMSTNQVGFMAM